MRGEVDLLVAVPWRDRGSRTAARSLSYVVRHLEDVTGVEPILVDSPSPVFSLAAARNRAFELSGGVVVVCDADTVPDGDALLAAIDLARTSPSVILPFTLFRALTPEATEEVLAGDRAPRDAADLLTLDWSVGGVQVASVATWTALGGQDERFTGWGCEDTAFYLTSLARERPHQRVEGQIHHLWHPRAVDERSPEYVYNEQLLRRYEVAYHDGSLAVGRPE